MKNDDMDELFRKAAENYEVDTSKASRWDAVNEALRSVDGMAAGDERKKKRKRRFFFWWLLLLPVVLVAYHTWKKMDPNREEPAIEEKAFNKTTEAVNEKLSKNDGLVSANSATNKAENTVVNSLKKPLDNNKTIIEKNNNDISLNGNNISQNKKNTAQNGFGSDLIEHSKKIQVNRSSGKVALNRTKKGVDEKTISIKSGNNTESNSKSDNEFEKSEKVFDADNRINTIVVDKKREVNHNMFTAGVKNGKVYINDNNANNNYKGLEDRYTGKTISGNFQYVFAEHDDRMRRVISSEKIIRGVAPGIVNQDTVANDSSLQHNKNKEDEKGQRYFYVAAVVAPDLSAVKFQRVAGTGSSVGLLLGYRINKRWHIETGAMWEKKIYYTKGDYFDKSKLNPYLRNVEILNADGNCYMITIPLNVRYNISARKNSNWFVATGMSSYLMNKEYYDFTYRHPGGQPVVRGYEYKTKEKNWMTVININLGYERAFLKSFNFRIEPYFRLPVSGVGTGNLSLSSGGVYIGIGKKF